MPVIHLGASFYFVEIGLAYLDLSGLSACFVQRRDSPVSVVQVTALTLPKDRRFWLTAMVMGALNNVIPFTLIAYGQQFVTGGLASIVNANTAFISVIISGIFVASEPARWNRIAGVLIGVFGVGIAIGLGGPQAGQSSEVGTDRRGGHRSPRCHTPRGGLGTAEADRLHADRGRRRHAHMFRCRLASQAA